MGRIMFDWSINLGNALTIFSFLVGGIVFVVTVRGRVDALAQRMSFVETELKKMVDVLIQQGRHDERMAAMDARIQSQGTRLDSLMNRMNQYINHINEEK